MLVSAAAYHHSANQDDAECYQNRLLQQNRHSMHKGIKVGGTISLNTQQGQWLTEGQWIYDSKNREKIEIKTTVPSVVQWFSLPRNILLLVPTSKWNINTVLE